MRKLETSLALVVLAALALPAQAKRCPVDSVQVGPICVDKYEASVWEIDPITSSSLVNRLQKGRAGLTDLSSGGTQHGVASDDYGLGCPDSGNGCSSFYAASIPGVTPAAYITWFQAVAACRNAGKRLLTNQEWQAAALGTPDPGTDNGTSDCNVGSTYVVANAGARNVCVSDTGAFDMVGNLSEWVADWADRAPDCTDWTSGTGLPGGDYSCFGGSGGGVPDRIPSALSRGGGFNYGTFAGVFTVYAGDYPSASFSGVGFRCAR